MTRWLLWAAFLACGTGCGGQGMGLGPGSVDDRIPLSTTGTGVPFTVEVTVGGVGPYRFVLDTGSSRTVVSDRLADEAGLRVRPTGATVLGAEGGRAAVSGEARVDRLEIGAVRLTGLDVLVMDLSGVGRTLGDRIDGILSAGDLRGQTLVLDYAEGSAWITAARVRDGERLRHDRLAMVRAEVGGRPTDIVLDSASGGGWMLSADRLSTQEMGFAPREVETADGTGVRARAEFDGTIKIGPHRFERPIVEPTSGLPRAGWHALRDFRVSIDGRSRRVLLERIANEDDGPVYGIGARLERDGSVWELRGVEPGWPAASAGLIDGERVLSIEGLRVDDVGAADLRRMMAERPRLRLEVLRGAGVQTVWVPVVYEQP